MGSYVLSKHATVALMILITVVLHNAGDVTFRKGDWYWSTTVMSMVHAHMCKQIYIHVLLPYTLTWSR